MAKPAYDPSSPSPACEVCTAPYLAWQIEKNCVLWRCPRCGHIERDIALSTANARSLEYGGDPQADAFRRRLTQRRILAATQGRRGRLLDVGCGDGSLARQLASDFTSVVGIDRHAASVVDGNVVLEDATFETFEAAAHSFDAITAIHVLEHVNDLAATLEHCHSLLVDGGVFYAITPNASSASLRVFREHWWMLEDPTHRRFLSEDSALNVLESAGFDSVTVTGLITDSLMCPAASAARSMKGELAPQGVLASRAARYAALVSTPAVAALRAVRPQWRDSIEIVARKSPQ